jgi:endonuclease/exonuclease/phosphatase (EEP) superfamily protein YafD
MPLLASIYAIFLGVVAVHSVHLHIVDRERVWFTVLDLIADLSVLAVFVLYWFPQAGRELRVTAAALFLFSVSWFVGWIPHNLGKAALENSPPEENQLFRRFVLMIAIVQVFPGYWFGGIGVLRSL